jgi:predicted acyl esterase
VAQANVVLTSDPRLLVPHDEVDADTEAAASLKDQRENYRNWPAQVIWHSEPFATETVLAGRPRLRLQLASDQPDADLFAQLSEVLPDGTVVYLSSTAVRLRYRTGELTATPMVPGKAELIRFQPFAFFARAVAKGSRLRLVIDSASRSWSVQHNNHTGGDQATEPIAKARIAKITLMTGPESGSALELPRPDEAVVPRKDGPIKHP